MAQRTKHNGCDKCKHFLQHYYFDDKLKLRIVNCGVCLKRDISRQDYVRFPFSNGCKEWEERETQSQNYRRVVEYAVERMENELSELKAILKIES